MKTSSILIRIVLMLFTLTAPAKAEDLVVVVNAGNFTTQLTQQQVINIFLGRYRYYPSGGQAEPIDLPEDSPVKAPFYRKLINKDLPDINAYWSRLLFSGRITSPARANSVNEMTRMLLRSKSAISYMPRSAVDSRFVMVYVLEEN